MVQTWPSETNPSSATFAEEYRVPVSPVPVTPLAPVTAKAAPLSDLTAMLEPVSESASKVPAFWCVLRSNTVKPKLKSLMRGSKPGIVPRTASMYVACRSVIAAWPATVAAEVSVPSASGKSFSPGSVSGLLRNCSSATRTPPSTVIGPRTVLTRCLSSSAITLTSPPSRTLSSIATTCTCCAWFQSAEVNLSCGVITTPPWLSRSMLTDAATVCPSARVTVITRPSTVAL